MNITVTITFYFGSGGFKRGEPGGEPGGAAPPPPFGFFFYKSKVYEQKISLR